MIMKRAVLSVYPYGNDLSLSTNIFRYKIFLPVLEIPHRK